MAFIVGEHYVERKFGSEGAAGALGIVVGAVVDGVPESIIFGIQLVSGEPISVAFVGAVFVSNIPQAIAPSADLAATGWNWRRVAALWSWVVLACGIASVMGYGGASVVSAVHGARMASFASGGILAMLSNSLIPFVPASTMLLCWARVSCAVSSPRSPQMLTATSPGRQWPAR